MTEVEQPPQNGIDLSTEEDDNNKSRPADIEQDMREMERRKRVEAIMNSKLFREELERIVDSQIREGGASGLLQQLSDIVGVPAPRVGSVFKSTNCCLPINDIRGIESMGYSKGEKILRCKLAATFRLLDVYGWTHGLGALITARLKVDQELFLVNPYGLLFHEVTASSLNKVDMQGQVIEQGTTNFGVNKSLFILHSIVHAARPDIRCAIYIGCSPVVAVSSLKAGILPLTKDSVVLGEISTYHYTGSLAEPEEREKLVRNLGPISKVMLLTNYGALCCGETIEEAFFAAHHIVQACEIQLKLLPLGIDNLVLIPEEARKSIYDSARRPPEDIAMKFAALAVENNTNAETAAVASGDASEVEDSSQSQAVENNKEQQPQSQPPQQQHRLGQPKWRVGGAEFEALMRMLDNAGFRTGYIYRHPLIKSELPKPKNDVELPPAVSSLGYLLEEEELYRQGIWKKGDLRKGGDRSRWLNSPNVYQKVEVLETGTPDPKKITKWVAEGSPTHSTPVRIEHPLQFVPHGTNPKEFKKVQQQIKDNRRADKISAGPQSHILEGVTWDEANRIKDATVSSAGDHVVLMGAASKGIIQRGFQHNATVYKTPYAKNPFDNVTDDELNEYKRTVERKKNIHGEYTDTDFSESEAPSSLQTSGPQQQNSSKTAVAFSQSETEDASEHQVMRIETQQAPIPSQPEVVLSDVLKLKDHLSCSLQNTSNQSYSTHSPSPSLTTNKTPIKLEQLQCAIQNAQTLRMLQKFSFLFEKHQQNELADDEQGNVNLRITTNMIYKIELTPHYTYPLAELYAITADSSRGSALPDQQNLPIRSPYRTVSHYGFNYPQSVITCIPSLSMLSPNILAAKVQLQRQKVIEFIYSTAKMLGKKKEHSGGELEQHHYKDDVQFISVKEINLVPLKTVVMSRHSPMPPPPPPPPEPESQAIQPVVHHLNDCCTEDHLSDQFSSLSTTGGGGGALFHADDENDSAGGETFNYSTASVAALAAGGNTGGRAVTAKSNRTESKNLYRSYKLRNFIPIHDRSRSFNDIRIKPESEQVFDSLSHDDSFGTTAKYSLQANDFPVKNHRKRTLHIRDARCSTASGGESSSLSSSSSSVEITINISIKNSSVKNFSSHENEIKSKLEKVIDDELSIISRQLQEQSAEQYRQSDDDVQNESPTLKYSDTLLLLENELENLLNSIIQANELHNKTVLCDCKTKIHQISEDVRMSLAEKNVN